ncbi:MAG: DUF4231 domain-containing protein [Halobacteriota archaeon]
MMNGKREVQVHEGKTEVAVQRLAEMKETGDRKEYIVSRVSGEIARHRNQADKAQRRYHGVQGAAVAAGALIPFLASQTFPYQPAVTTSFGLLVFVLISLQGMLQYPERMQAHRAISSALVRECFAYLTQAPPYNRCLDDRERFALFYKRAEGIISREGKTAIHEKAPITELKASRLSAGVPRPPEKKPQEAAIITQTSKKSTRKQKRE